MNKELVNGVEKLRTNFNNGDILSISKRICVLREFLAVLQKNEGRILDALTYDIGKGDFEGYLSELSLVYNEATSFIKHLHKWTKAKKSWALVQGPGKFVLEYRPYGIVLIIVPFNYPILLSLIPLIGAIAAGNMVVLRFSKDTPCVATCVAQLIEQCSLREQVLTLPYDDTSKQLISTTKFDYIFFTGSSSVGRMMAAKAAQDLIPITMELGGKSPCIVDERIDLNKAAKRILFGKLMNAGQSCVAPDYLIVNKAVVEEFLLCLKQQKDLMIDELSDQEWPKIINERSFIRLKSYFNHAQIVFGGKYQQKNLKMQLSVIIPDSWDHPALKEEIFGPILPVLTYNNNEELASILKLNPDPLALYVFSDNTSFIADVVEGGRYGGVCINDTMLHMTSNKYPFGGVGNSGFGRYHGMESLKTFSYQRVILTKKLGLDFDMRYRPYSIKDYKKIKNIMKGA